MDKATRGLTTRLTWPLTLSLDETNTRPTGGGKQHTAFSPIKRTLQQDSGDINGIVIGDSLFNATDEAVYLWFAWLATQYPAFTFVYYPPNGSGGYGAPSTIQIGTGTHTFRLRNSSVSGTRSDFLMGSKFATAFPIEPDFVLWNYGKNHVGGSTEAFVYGEFLGPMAQVQLAFPSAQHIVIDQYPNLDTAMEKAHNAWVDLCANTPAISRIDLYTPTYEASDYVDNSHMTPAANLAKLLPLFQAYWNRTIPGDWVAPVPWLTTTVSNLLDGDSGQRYADFGRDSGVSLFVGAKAGSSPLGWTANLPGTTTFEVETSITFGGAARSQKISASGSSPRIDHSLTVAKLALAKGQWCCLTVVRYVPEGAPASAGRFQVVQFSPGPVNAGSFITRSRTEGQGGWNVVCLLFRTVEDLISLPHSLFHDNAASAFAGSVYFQWACLTTGKIPRSPA